jgi:hypothetical protein
MPVSEALCTSHAALVRRDSIGADPQPSSGCSSWLTSACVGWALWLTTVVSALNIQPVAPALVFAPYLTGLVLATIGVVAFTLVILLGVLCGSRYTNA